MSRSVRCHPKWLRNTLCFVQPNSGPEPTRMTSGISVERSGPGCPQDNSAHERMHFEMRCELEAGRIGRDQAAFDLWRQGFNQIRPHEALAYELQLKSITGSQWPYQGTPEDLDYGSMFTRKVHANCAILFYPRKRQVFTTSCFEKIHIVAGSKKLN